MFLPDIKKYFSEFNKKSHSEQDAIDFCTKNKIYIVEAKKLAHGKYQRYKGIDFILINPKLKDSMRLWVLWHEIGHFLFHAPETSYFSIQKKTKNDREANNFAAVMMMPKKMVETRTVEELMEMFPRALILIRKNIYDSEKGKV